MEKLKRKVQAAATRFGNRNATRLDDEVDLQVGTKVYPSVPRRLRLELWLSIVNSRAGSGLDARNRFQEYLAKGVPDLVADEIGKDTKRTFPDLEELNTPARQMAFQAVLRAYAAYDSEVGYCQGMNFLAGLLLVYVEDPADAFGLLVVLLRDRRLRELYKPDMNMLQARLWHINKLMPPVLSVHLESHAVMPVLYASSWLMTCFASDFPAPFAARVMDTVLCNSHLEPLMKVAVCVLRSTERVLLDMDDMEEMVELLKVKLPASSPDLLQRLLTEALGSPWSMHERQLLCEIEGVETVAAALERVENGGSSGRPSTDGDALAAATARWAGGVDGAAVTYNEVAVDAELLTDFEERLEAKFGPQGGPSAVRMRAKPRMAAMPAAATGAACVPKLSGLGGGGGGLGGSAGGGRERGAGGAGVAGGGDWRSSLAKARSGASSRGPSCTGSEQQQGDNLSARPRSDEGGDRRSGRSGDVGSAGKQVVAAAAASRSLPLQPIPNLMDLWGKEGDGDASAAPAASGGSAPALCWYPAPAAARSQQQQDTAQQDAAAASSDGSNPLPWPPLAGGDRAAESAAAAASAQLASKDSWGDFEAAATATGGPPQALCPPAAGRDSRSSGSNHSAAGPREKAGATGGEEAPTAALAAPAPSGCASGLGGAAMQQRQQREGLHQQQWHQGEGLHQQRQQQGQAEGLPQQGDYGLHSAAGLGSATLQRQQQGEGEVLHQQEDYGLHSAATSNLSTCSGLDSLLSRIPVANGGAAGDRGDGGSLPGGLRNSNGVADPRNSGGINGIADPRNSSGSNGVADLLGMDLVEGHGFGNDGALLLEGDGLDGDGAMRVGMPVQQVASSSAGVDALMMLLDLGGGADVTAAGTTSSLAGAPAAAAVSASSSAGGTRGNSSGWASWDAPPAMGMRGNSGNSSSMASWDGPQYRHSSPPAVPSLCKTQGAAAAAAQQRGLKLQPGGSRDLAAAAALQLSAFVADSTNGSAQRRGGKGTKEGT